MGRESFVLYTKINEVVRKLTDAQKGKLFQAILDYEETGKQPEFDDLMLELVFVPIRQDLDKCNEKWAAQAKARSEAGKRGMESRYGKKNVTNDNSVSSVITSDSSVNPVITEDNKEKTAITNATDNVNVNVNVNENVDVNENDCVDENVNNNPPISPQGDGEKEPSLQERRFEEFWSVYPKKKAKDAARRAWKKINPDESLCATIVKSVSDHIARDSSWAKDGGQYIPHPATYLNSGGWQDELTQKAPEADCDDYDPNDPYKYWK